MRWKGEMREGGGVKEPLILTPHSTGGAQSVQKVRRLWYYVDVCCDLRDSHRHLRGN